MKAVLWALVVAQLVFDGWACWKLREPTFDPAKFSTSNFPGDWTVRDNSATVWRFERRTGHVDIYNKSTAKWYGLGELSADKLMAQPAP